LKRQLNCFPFDLHFHLDLRLFSSSLLQFGTLPISAALVRITAQSSTHFTLDRRTPTIHVPSQHLNATKFPSTSPPLTAIDRRSKSS